MIFQRLQAKIKGQGTEHKATYCLLTLRDYYLYTVYIVLYDRPKSQRVGK